MCPKPLASQNKNDRKEDDVYKYLKYDTGFRLQYYKIFIFEKV